MAQFSVECQANLLPKISYLGSKFDLMMSGIEVMLNACLANRGSAQRTNRVTSTTNADRAAARAMRLAGCGVLSDLLCALSARRELFQIHAFFNNSIIVEFMLHIFYLFREIIPKLM